MYTYIITTHTWKEYNKKELLKLNQKIVTGHVEQDGDRPW